jgi:hypothetical protein
MSSSHPASSVVDPCICKAHLTLLKIMASASNASSIFTLPQGPVSLLKQPEAGRVSNGQSDDRSTRTAGEGDHGDTLFLFPILQQFE